MALFIGVTKASVSKWENGQSMPDILLLPRLAAYFDVSIDNLMGYIPQLSKEQIQMVYKNFTEEFSKNPFEEVFAKSEDYVKKYYSCYKFLVQMCVLWINHYMLAEGTARQQEILEKTEALCNHIITNCNNAIIFSDAIVMRANISLLLGKPEVVIDDLEDLMNPCRLVNQSDGMLIQAYLMKGDMDKANKFTQISMYNHIGIIINESIQLLGIYAQNREKCFETIKRVEKLIDAYSLDGLLQQILVAFYLQAAVVLCSYGEYREAIESLEKYVTLMLDMLENTPMLHGDNYFDKLDECFEELDIGSQMVRDKKLVIDSGIAQLDNPVFTDLKELPEYADMRKKLEGLRERI